MATIQTVNNGDSGFVARTKINNNDANINSALEAAEALLTTDNASLDDFQKITDAIEAIQATLSVNDAAYDTLQEIVDKLKTAETKLATIETGAEVNVQADWNESDNTNDAFIQNKPALGTASGKDVGTAIGNLQENGAILGNSQIVETDATGKFITVAKNTAYNANFGTGNTDVARGDASYLKADTYTQTEVNNALTNNSTDDRARANHTGEQAIATITGLQTALDAKEATANKGVANGYAGLDSNAQVPLSQLPANAQGSKVVADIATRDVIANADRYEGLPVHVLDATADSTVTSGGAGYILKSGLANTDWEKVYESESLDIDLSVYFNKNTDTTDNITEGTAKFTTQANIDKLAGIEPNATADQTPAEIKADYESNLDTNAFTDAEQTKLAGIEPNATADQSDSEIKIAYENNADTNAFTDAEKTNLSNQSGTNTGDETTISIQTKRPLKTIEGQILEGSGNIDLTSSDVGLGNVDNTSDADKPISTTQQTALDGKLAKASNLSDVNDRQTAVNTLTDVASATNEYVLTKDTTTGNAVFKPAAGGGSGTNLSISAITGTTLDINSDTGTDVTVPAATPSNAGLMTSADKTKLDGVEANATADQTDAEIKTAYENNLDTNAFTDVEQTKLAGIDSNLVGKLPTGAVVMSIASSLSGALKFDGVSSYSKTTYSTLYALISSIVGTAVDVDANNFFLPDPSDRVLGIAGSTKTLFSTLGADTIALLEANIPAHYHFEFTDDDVNNVSDINSSTSPARKRSATGSTANYTIEQGSGSATEGQTSTVGSSTAFSIQQKTFIAGQNLFIFF